MTEEAEQLIEKFDKLVRQALTLAEEGHVKEANEIWHRSIVPTFAKLWRLTQVTEEFVSVTEAGID